MTSLQERTDLWIDNAVSTITEHVARFALDATFTTKDFWVLLEDTPGDRRGPMRSVMRRLVDDGALSPDGFTRDPGAAITKDGWVFSFNKPVTRYRKEIRA